MVSQKDPLPPRVLVLSGQTHRNVAMTGSLLVTIGCSLRSQSPTESILSKGLYSLPSQVPRDAGTDPLGVGMGGEGLRPLILTPAPQRPL